MHVGVVTASMSRRSGGLLGAISPLVRELSNRECKVTIFSIVDENSVEDACHWRAVRLELQERLGPQSFAFAPRLGKAMDSANLDLVHAHGLWMYPSIAAARWAKRWHKPLIVSPHGMLDPWALGNSKWKKRLAMALFERRNLETADCLHALNEAEAEAIRNLGLLNPIAIIPNGVDLPPLSTPSSDPTPASNDARRMLLFLGRLHPKKGIAETLRAWALARTEKPDLCRDWRLVIAGWDDGSHQGELETLCRDLGLTNDVTFAGAVFGADREDLLARSSAFILASHSEGLPMSVLEAWSYGKPVFMTRGCNLPEGFDANAAIEISTEPAQIASQLVSHLPREDLVSIGQNGRSLVEARFSWENVADRLNSVYTWLIEQTGTPPEDVRLA